MAPGRGTQAGRRAHFELRPERDVEDCAEGQVALSIEPWLALGVSELADLVGGFVEITYRASFLDEPVRPIFRFWRDDGRCIDAVAPAPVAGAAIWIGRVPKGTTRISVSPTNRLGPFGFVVETVRRRIWPWVVRLGLTRNPRATRSALLTRLIGWRPESDVNLAWAIGALPFSDYAGWAAPRSRPVDIAGLDAPRFDWSQAPDVRIVVLVEGRDDALGATLDSLRAQAFPRWTALVFGGSDARRYTDPRIVRGTTDAARDQIAPLGDWTCVLRAGDRLAPFALAFLIEQARRHPSVRLFFADTLFCGDDGALVPRFEPGWKPDRPAAVFVKTHSSLSAEAKRGFVAGENVAVDALGGEDVRPLRRLLLERRAASPQPAAALIETPIAAAPGGRAALIIPTRDHPALLRRLVDSVRTHSRSGLYEIVIVDNGSITPEAKILLAELERGADIIRIDRPGPFDFSAMCNAGAAATQADVLVFLNDDTIVLHDDWLDRLIAQAMAPGLGAIGAKLTYPDGRIQHIGVTVGLGGSAGHFGALDLPDAPGWAGRSLVPHAVSAVTGACLAVARQKFFAVSGFDAANLPVELSDVDLCLKLNARGWQTLVDPGVHLVHEESVSRGGATFRRLDLYESQRAVFLDRWRDVVRDDPFFHPALSLYSLRPALG